MVNWPASLQDVEARHPTGDVMFRRRAEAVGRVMRKKFSSRTPAGGGEVVTRSGGFVDDCTVQDSQVSRVFTLTPKAESKFDHES